MSGGSHKLHVHVRLESNHRVWVVGGYVQMIRLVMCTDMRVGKVWRYIMGLESQMSIGVGGSDDYQLNLALRPATMDILVSLFALWSLGWDKVNQREDHLRRSKEEQ